MLTITNLLCMIYECTNLEQKQILLKFTRPCTVFRIKAIFWQKISHLSNGGGKNG